MTPNEIVAALRKLSGDFETLADDARDDLQFIYKWTPPDWYEWWQREENPQRNIEIAAMLQMAADIIAKKGHS